MENTVTEWIQIGSLFIASLVAYLSLITYKSNKNIELQNHLFELKMVAFSNLISEFIKLLSIYERTSFRFQKIMKQQLDFDIKAHQLNKLSYKIDAQIIEVHMGIGKNSVYFSARTTKLLNDLTNQFYGDFDFEDDVDLERIINVFEAHIKKQADELDLVIEKIREELGLEKLNEELLKRVKKGKLKPVS